MSLEATVADVARQLRAGRYPNEQAVSQGIVLRVLGELGWDIWNPAVVWPEFKTSEGRVDFALCHPPEKPAIFVEVKQPGKAEESVRQALLYAFHAGVPFVVLTDGLTWSFYLPTEQGTYEERRVYKLDLYERSPEEAAAALRRYLDRKQVESGQALEMAKGEYRSRNRQAQARQAIPLAWRELVDRGDEQLVELVTGAVECIRHGKDVYRDLEGAVGCADGLPHCTSKALHPRGTRQSVDGLPPERTDPERFRSTEWIEPFLFGHLASEVQGDGAELDSSSAR